MLDAASLKSGGKVLMVSSLDEEHPGENVLDGNDQTYWISTGLYPQEILVQLCSPAIVTSLMIASTHVRQLRIEGCHEDMPINFQLLADGDLVDKNGDIQVKELPCHEDKPLRYIRMMILSGWHDFCSVHRLQVKAHGARRNSEMPHRSDSFMEGRRPSKARNLNVQIPPHELLHPDEPDAPRSSREPWAQNETNGFRNDPLSPRPAGGKQDKLFG
jgi:heat shock protein beta-11